jgi:hypothetical protein
MCARCCCLLTIDTIGLTQLLDLLGLFRPLHGGRRHLFRLAHEGEAKCGVSAAAPAVASLIWATLAHTEILHQLSASGLNMVSQAKSPGVTIGRD